MYLRGSNFGSMSRGENVKSMIGDQEIETINVHTDALAILVMPPVPHGVHELKFLTQSNGYAVWEVR